MSGATSIPHVKQRNDRSLLGLNKQVQVRSFGEVWKFAICHLNCSYYYFKWIHLSMWSLSLPPLITRRSERSPRTRLLRVHPLKSALMFPMWRWSPKQNSSEAIKKYHPLSQPCLNRMLSSNFSPAVRETSTFDLTLDCISDMNGCRGRAFQSRSQHKFWWEDADVEAVEFHTIKD